MQGTGRDSAAMLLVFDLAALGVGDVQLPEGKQGLKVQLQTRVDA